MKRLSISELLVIAETSLAEAEALETLNSVSPVITGVVTETAESPIKDYSNFRNSDPTED